MRWVIHGEVAQCVFGGGGKEKEKKDMLFVDSKILSICLDLVMISPWRPARPTVPFNKLPAVARRDKGALWNQILTAVSHLSLGV